MMTKIFRLVPFFNIIIIIIIIVSNADDCTSVVYLLRRSQPNHHCQDSFSKISNTIHPSHSFPSTDVTAVVHNNATYPYTSNVFLSRHIHFVYDETECCYTACVYCELAIHRNELMYGRTRCDE